MFRNIIIGLMVLTFSAISLAQAGEAQYTYEGYLARGHAQYLAKNYAGALSEYEQAKALAPTRADAYYFMGCAVSKQNRYDDAVNFFKNAATIAAEADVNMHAKSMFLIAVVWERAGELAKAKFAWSEYKNFAKSHSGTTMYSQVADDRVKVIERAEKLNSDYQIVRDRIASGKN